MEGIGGDNLRGHLEAMILSTLERGEAHGLEILRSLEQSGCGLLRLKEGSLYPALNRLEAAGEIKAAWEEESHGRRGARRRIYCLTPKGRRKLDGGRGEWQQFVRIVGGILGASARAMPLTPS
jgi:DNA-binding PadR family transcriptional regulator